jgi:hypothetical protein
VLEPDENNNTTTERSGEHRRRATMVTLRQLHERRLNELTSSRDDDILDAESRAYHRYWWINGADIYQSDASCEQLTWATVRTKALLRYSLRTIGRGRATERQRQWQQAMAQVMSNGTPISNKITSPTTVQAHRQAISTDHSSSGTGDRRRALRHWRHWHWLAQIAATGTGTGTGNALTGTGTGTGTGIGRG